MRILFSHTNFPAQFRRLVPALVQEGHDVVFLAKSKEWHATHSEGFRLLKYECAREGGSAAIHPYLRKFESAVLEGQACYRLAMGLVDEGWFPDWIINHVGYGNGFYLGDAFPQARRIGLFEWYYKSIDSDVDFLEGGFVHPDRQLKLRTWNAQILLELADCDHCITPTYWQRQQFPDKFRDHMTVLHEGIDVEFMGTLKKQSMPRPSVLPDDPRIEVVTYVSRCFEEYRGFPQVMRALELLQQRRPNLHVLIAGHDGIAYGAGRADGRSWGKWAREECQLDPANTHWLGMLQEQEYWQVLAHSQVHIYLTIPFVLSWSLLEAMAAGCALVASDTPPVQEVLSHEDSALLVDFFDSEAQACAIERLLDNPILAVQLANSAKQRVQDYGAAKGIADWKSLLGVRAC